MDFDGSLSTEVAIIHDKQAYYDDIVTYGLPLSNEGKPMPSQIAVILGADPKGAKNVDVGQGLRQIPDPAQGQRPII